MQFHFAWIKEGDVFCSKTHCHEGEKVFSFQIFESEGALPKAKIRIEASPDKSVDGTHFILLLEENCLFKGQVTHVSFEKQGRIAVLHCIGFDAIIGDGLEALRADLSNDPGVEPLFMTPQKRAEPELWEIPDLLLHRPEIVYIPRDLSKISLVPLVPKQEYFTFDVSDIYYVDSLRHVSKSSKYQSVSIVLKADWIQRYSGTTDITQALRERLSLRGIETFTAIEFQNKWWRTNHRFGVSGYRVEDTSINILGVGREIPFDDLSERSQEKLARRHSSGKIKEGLTLKSTVLQPNMSLSWRYIQPRREEVRLTFSGNEILDSEVKKITLKLRNLTDKKNILHWSPDIYYQQGEWVDVEDVLYLCSVSHRSTFNFFNDDSFWRLKGPRQSYPLLENQGMFFETKRGQEVIHAAADIARVYQMALERSHEISFQCALGEALHLSTSSFIKIPGEENLLGKVTKLCFEALGNQGRFRAYVTVSCVDMTIIHKDVSCKDSYDLILLEEKGNRGHKEPHLFSGNELLKEVIVRHGADEQLSQLQEEDTEISSGIQGTQVRLHLEDLRTREASLTRYGVKI